MTITKNKWLALSVTIIVSFTVALLLTGCESEPATEQTTGTTKTSAPQKTQWTPPPSEDLLKQLYKNIDSLTPPGQFVDDDILPNAQVNFNEVEKYVRRLWDMTKIGWEEDRSKTWSMNIQISRDRDGLIGRATSGYWQQGPHVNTADGKSEDELVKGLTQQIQDIMKKHNSDSVFISCGSCICRENGQIMIVVDTDSALLYNIGSDYWQAGRVLWYASRTTT